MTDKDAAKLPRNPDPQQNMTGWQVVDDIFRYSIDKSAYIFMGIATAVLSFYVRRATLVTKEARNEAREAKDESRRSRRAARVNTKKITNVQQTLGDRADSIDKKIEETADKTVQATLDATTISTAAALTAADR